MFNETATFITSAPRLEDCPPDSKPEICFAGRSNVGKSSLINALLNRKNLARTSNVPGKTQQMNYYSIGETAFFVDLPGYGYAKVPKKERERWGKNIREYLMNRKALRLIIHVVDARHKPTALDEDFFYWMAANEMPFCVLLSKADKISKNKGSKAKADVRKVLASMNIEVPILAYSADNKAGIEEVQDLIMEFIEE
mgnify:CR=1 FL=1|tara:strand:- start:94609 stop:95199 length:591 start_codon:yes stop_codon:yes gene_type:complete